MLCFCNKKICVLCYQVPLTKNLFQLMVPSLILGLAFGMVECAMIPYLGYLVDLRHVAAYGTVYGLSQFIFCLANVVGKTTYSTKAINIVASDNKYEYSDIISNVSYIFRILFPLSITETWHTISLNIR